MNAYNVLMNVTGMQKQAADEGGSLLDGINLDEIKSKGAQYLQQGKDWLGADTNLAGHNIPNWLLAGGGSLLGLGGLYGLKQLLSGSSEEGNPAEEQQRLARMAKAGAARAMHATDPTEGPTMSQRPTLTATSSLDRLMQITRTRGLHNQDFGQHGMSSVSN